MPRLLDLILAGLAYGGALFLVFSLTRPEFLERAEWEAGVFFWLQTLDDGILLVVALVFGRIRFPGSWRALGFREVGARWLALGAGGGAAATALAWLTAVALDRWGWPAPPHPVESVLGAAQSGWEVLIVLLAVTVPVPIAEETFFRGWAYRVMRARLGVVAAMALSSLAFALMHGLEVAAWLPILPVGLMFAVLAERTGSLWPGIIGHAVVNAIAVLAGA